MNEIIAPRKDVTKGVGIPTPSNRPPALSKPRLDVKKLMQHYLAAFAVSAKLNDARRVASRPGHWLDKDYYGKFYGLDLDSDRNHIREMAVAVLGELPTVAQLESVDGEISKWLERPPENAARQIVATMLDGFKQKPSEGAAIFLDAMIYILGDMPAAAIAAATREVWETEDWAPSIHAFVDLCKKHRSTLSSVRRDVDLILKKRKDLGEIMALIELDPTGAEQMAEHKRVEEMTRTLKRRERNETI